MSRDKAVMPPNDVCAVSHCQQRARWTVRIDGHPNASGKTGPHSYCTEHAREKAGTLWEDSPKPYRVTVEGPLP